MASSTGKRGSEKVMPAWKARILTEASVKEIGAAPWLEWHQSHGGTPRPPRIIINGIPFPDLVRMELELGHVEEHVPSLVENVVGELAAVGLRG